MNTDGAPPAPEWLRWVRTLRSIAQAGLTYAESDYDRERYETLRHVAAEMAAARSDGQAEQIESLFARERGYPTPKVDVRAAVIVEDRILLVREREDGRWSMPGGWADVGDTPAGAAERETREEAGIAVRATKLIALLDRQRHPHPIHPEYSYKAFFACAPIDGAEPRPGHETLGAEFFPRTGLPELSLARVLESQIDLAFAHAANPALSTVFD